MTSSNGADPAAASKGLSTPTRERDVTVVRWAATLHIFAQAEVLLRLFDERVIRIDGAEHNGSYTIWSNPPRKCCVAISFFSLSARHCHPPAHCPNLFCCAGGRSVAIAILFHANGDRHYRSQRPRWSQHGSCPPLPRQAHASHDSR